MLNPFGQSTPVGVKELPLLASHRLVTAAKSYKESRDLRRGDMNAWHPTEDVRIWNRACLEDVAGLGPGDVALAAMVRFDGLVQNGGFLHAVGCNSTQELESVKSGYRYFRLADVAELIAEGRFLIAAKGEVGASGEELDARYKSMTKNDALEARFKDMLSVNRDAFAPVSMRDSESQ